MKTIRLNIACGANVFPGWCNIDKTDVEKDYLRHLRDAPDSFVWPEPQRELAAWVKAGKPLEFIQYDVRRGLLLWEDASVDAIYIGQAIEHFNRRTEAPALLRECLRVLKPGGAIRLTTPSLNTLLEAWYQDDLSKFAPEQPAFFAGASVDEQLSYLLFGASGPDCTAENYEGHFHCYSPTALARLLKECGFNTEQKTSYWHHVASPVFHDTRDFGMSHSFGLEAVKP